MSSVGDELLNEIERISAKRERWRGYAKEAGPQAAFGPSIILMTMELDAAKKAISDGDAIACIEALQALKEYNDDD